MVSRIVLHTFCVLAFWLSLSSSTSHWTGRIKFEKQLNSKKEPIEKDDELILSEEFESPKGQSSDNVTFWMLDENVTEVSEFHNPQNETEKDENSTTFETSMENSEPILNDTPSVELVEADKEDIEKEDKNIQHDVFVDHVSKMNENILLPRNNCNLEIEVSETEDVRVRIKLEPLKQNTSGKCCITLNGYEGTMLAVLVSDIHLHGYVNDSIQGETLKILVTSAGVDFVIKQYCGKDQNLPLLLTETNRVYLILYYNVTTITPSEASYTEFNLEAFTYHKHENSVMNKVNYENHYSTPKRNIQNVYFTTEKIPNSF